MSRIPMMPIGKTSAAQRKASRKYDSKFKRVTVRLPVELLDKIKQTGYSTNSFIVGLLKGYFDTQK